MRYAILDSVKIIVLPGRVRAQFGLYDQIIALPHHHHAAWPKGQRFVFWSAAVVFFSSVGYVERMTNNEHRKNGERLYYVNGSGQDN